MSTLKVDGIRSNSASSDAITLASDGTCTVNITNNLSNRNLIINGAMQVAQRGTSSTAAGYHTCDRIYFAYGGENETPTAAQVDVASGTTPFTLGFRKAFKVTNGNQTATDASDYLVFYTVLEAQDIANSGWNYLSTSSYITISFWAKSSVAKTFNVKLTTNDGTAQQYNHRYALSANTWTKVTKTIPGNSNLQFDNDANKGVEIQWDLYSGTNWTSGSTVDQWVTYNGNTSCPDDTADWWTTNDATFELTGVQLEVGDHATDYEHKRYSTELQDCQRYYEEIEAHSSGGIAVAIGQGYATRKGFGYMSFKVTKRAAPTAPNVDIAIDGGDANHDCWFNTTTSGTTIRSNTSTDIGNADITSGGWTGKFSAEL